jgi:hypothetical protein
MGTTAVPEKKTAQDATPALQAAHAPVAAPAAPKGIVGTAAADGGPASGAGPAKPTPVRNAAREAAKARVKKVWDYKGIAGN